MTKSEYIALAEAEYDKLKALHAHDSFYDYEKDFAAIWMNLGRAVLEESLGKSTSDVRKKTLSVPDSEK